MLIKRELIIFSAICVFAVLCYLTVIPTYFLSDDFVLIWRVAQQGMFYTWGEQHGGFLRPGTVLSYLIDYKFWKLNPVGYHLTNVIFHAIAAYALYLISFNLMGKAGYQSRRMLSFLTACLFIALPCHSESVSWISGRTDVIATAFGFIATLGFLFVLQKKSLLASLLALLFFSLALLTKESVIVFPIIWCMLYLYTWRSEKLRPSNHSLVILVAAHILLVGYFGLRKVTLGSFIGGYGSDQHLSLMQIQTLYNVGKYSIRTLLPGVLPLSSLPLLLFVTGFVIVTLIIIAGAFFRKGSRLYNRPLFALLISSYLLSLVPVATMSVSLSDTQNERFLYLPSAFICILITSLIGMAFRSAFIQNGVLLLLGFIFGFALQWVNNRWIVASTISKEIVGEISKMELDNLVIINIPSHYQGVYIFHNGLYEAAMLHGDQKAERKLGYLQAIVYHNLMSPHQMVHAGVVGSTILVTFPQELHFVEREQKNIATKREGWSLSISIPHDEEFKKLRWLFFESGDSKPMFRSIDLR